MTVINLFNQHHYNRQLFSDYYLNTILPQRADWQALANDTDVQALMQQITAIWQGYIPSKNEPEAQTEHAFIRPVLEALVHTFDVQPSLTTPDGTKRPDYILYRDDAARQANTGKTLTEDMLHSACAVADAKHWDCPLDKTLQKTKTSSRDFFSNKNPSYQIDFYIRHSGLEWGILTNGRKWRLYHSDTSKKLDCFYEVDLQEILKTVDPRAFLYFYAFFHRTAFDDHPLSIDAIRRESIISARGISDSIKQQVYMALRNLAQGFLDYPTKTLNYSADKLQQIYDHALIVLYRLLFILYAEARELLPLRTNRSYREIYSLYALANEITHYIDEDKELTPMSTKLWGDIQALFRIIDQGNPPLKVATFNGGLFDPKRYSFLEENPIGDARLLDAIDLLTRVEGEFVDYRDLAEQHLGTIYEGLLEYHLEPIEREGYWTIDLFNDKGERKVTGSYYTPDFVVDYMVEQTIIPVLQEAVANVPEDDDEAKIRAVLNTKVLDPSMGSGHFLVAATDTIARFLVDLGVRVGDVNGEPDLAYWKRRVIQTCIYGVDVNPLAVDLAKLSLWLKTVTKGRPLSFLDHHLRCGNALVGAWLDTLSVGSVHQDQQDQEEEDNGQLSMLADEGFRRSLSTAVDLMWLIQQHSDNTIADVREQECLHAEMLEQLTYVYRKLADVSTATFFGLEFDPQYWSALHEYAIGGDKEEVLEPIIKQTQELVDIQRFFHWELEFPEVFFDQHGQPLDAQAGFHVVIGNPPYVRQELLSLFKPFFEQSFAATYHGMSDLFVYFYEQGLRLLRQNGHLAYISSNKWFRAGYGVKLREYLAHHATLERIIDFGDAPIFAEAITYPAIVMLRKSAASDTHTFPSLAWDTASGDVKDFAVSVQDKSTHVAQASLTARGWYLVSTDSSALLAKLRASGKSLGSYVQGRFYYGIKTGLNAAFVVDRATRDRLIQEHPSSDEILKPFLRGRDVKRWRVESQDRWLIFSHRGIDINQYPAVYKHLLQYKKQLENRTPGHYAWYELQASPGDTERFEQPKIVYPDIAQYAEFTYDTNKYFVGDTMFLIPTDKLWLLGLLNSNAVFWFYTKICSQLRGGFVRYKSQYVSQIPIPEASADAQQAIGDLAKQLTNTANTRYTLEQDVRHRILSDLGTPGNKLNQKLEHWWELDFPALRAQVKKAFRQDIPVKERKNWEDWLATQRAAHQQYTADIVQLETDLNAQVYALFDLTPAEIRTVEESTQYAYGAG